MLKRNGFSLLIFLFILSLTCVIWPGQVSGGTLESGNPAAVTRDVTSQAAYAPPEPRVAPFSSVEIVGYIGVSSLTPSFNQLDVSPDSVIVVTFTSDINPATVEAGSFNVDSLQSGPIAGGFSVTGTSVTFSPASDFRSGDTIAVTLTTGITSTDGRSLPAPVGWSFTTAVSTTQGYYSTTVIFDPGTDDTASIVLSDLDCDGDLDIAVANNSQPNTVFLNNGPGVFAPGSIFDPGYNDSTALAAGDLNNDGFPDLVVANLSARNEVLLNDGTGYFIVSEYLGAASDATSSVALGDLNGDGFLDIVTGNTAYPGVVYLNNGDGTFNLLSTEFGSAGRPVTAIALGDADNDGDLDIAVGEYGQPNVVYYNDGDATFDTLSLAFGSLIDQTTGVAMGDLNGDGYLDLAVANEYQTNVLYLNNGDGTFNPAGIIFSVNNDRTSALAVGDQDGDGDLDIVVTNNGTSNVVYFNDGDATFDTLSRGFGTQIDPSGCITLGDVNSDGDLDLVLGNQAEQNVVYFNFSPAVLVKGNGIEIPNGDADPDLLDNTDFGHTSLFGGMVENSFTLTNTGDGNLVIASLYLDGTQAADFDITEYPATTISAGGTTEFTVRFTPSQSGLRQATLILTSNDLDQTPFTFDIQGTGDESQVFYFTTEVHPVAGLVMQKVDPSLSNQTLQPSTPQYWLADRPAGDRVTFSRGEWIVYLETDSEWPVSVQVGAWGDSFRSFTPDSSRIYYDDGIVTLHVFTSDVTLELGEYLAVEVINADSVEHTVIIGGSFFSVPLSSPFYPVPDLPAVVLLASGLAGLIVLLILSLKKSRQVEPF